MKKKVFLLQEIIPSYRVPVFRRIAEIKGVDLTVFFSSPSREKRENNLQNAVDLSSLKSVKLPLFSVGRFVWQFTFLRYILLDKPDVVIVGQAGRFDSLLFLLFCRLNGVRFLWFLGGVPYKDKKKIDADRNRGLINHIFGAKNPRRWLINRADGMIVYSDHAKKYFMSLGFSGYRIWVAHNSPDTDALQKYEQEFEDCPDAVTSFRQKLAPDSEKIIFLLGRLNQGRKADFLIHAINKVQKNFPAVKLVIVGDGDQRKSLEMLAASLGVNAFFAGAIYDERYLTKYFKVCDVFCVPGASSLAVKMAMLFGKPVISVDYGLEMHVVEDGVNGLIFPDGDLSALVRALLKLLQDNNEAVEMGVAARNTIISKVNVNVMVENFNKAIFNVMPETT